MHRHLPRRLLDRSGIEQNLIEAPTTEPGRRGLPRLVVGDDQPVALVIEAIDNAAKRHTAQVGLDVVLRGPNVDGFRILERPEPLDGLPGFPTEVLAAGLVEAEGPEIRVGLDARPLGASDGLGHLHRALMRVALHEQLEHTMGERTRKRRLPRRIRKALDIAHTPTARTLLERAGARRRQAPWRRRYRPLGTVAHRVHVVVLPHWCDTGTLPHLASAP